MGSSGAGQQWLADNISGAVSHKIKGGGHSTLFDSAEENVRVVVNFLKGHNDLTADLRQHTSMPEIKIFEILLKKYSQFYLEKRFAKAIKKEEKDIFKLSHTL